MKTNAKDPDLREGMIKLLESLRTAEQPVVSVRVTEKNTPGGLEGTKIQIASRAGVVHLSGRIQSELQRDMAVQLVRNIDGVRSVNAADLQQR